MVRRRDRSEQIAAEATAWLARLESTGRTPATEAGLRSWLESDGDHRRLFEQAMDLWAIVPGAAELLSDSRPVSQAPSPATTSPRRSRTGALALAASVLLVCLLSGWLLVDRPAAYSTAIGEQQVTTLEDGSRIALNADTELSVRYDPKTRSVQLDKGEAMFEVTHNPSRPFVVEAGNKRVTALGTSFVVRKIGETVVVTLISGKVRVDTLLGGDSENRTAATVLAPGERLTAIPESPEVVAMASTEAATAWRRGQVVFDDTTLSSAVSDLNRYGGLRIELADPRLGSLPVSGVFATNDTAEFASAVAALHGLNVERAGDRMRLSR